MTKNNATKSAIKSTAKSTATTRKAGAKSKALQSKKKSKAPRSRKAPVVTQPWTVREDHKIITERAAGRKNSDIAKELLTTAAAVANRHRALMRPAMTAHREMVARSAKSGIYPVPYTEY